MSTITVRKDGSGTYTTILEAYLAASPNDIIDIGAGTFVESLEWYKNNIQIIGAGRDQTIIQGNYVAGALSQATGCSWTLGNNFFTYTAQNTGTVFIPFAVGMSVGDTSATLAVPGGFPAASQITSIDVANKRVYINKTFTATQTGKTVKHYGVQATFEVRSAGFNISGVKIIDMSGSVVSGSVEYSAIFLGANTVTPALSKYSGSHSTGFSISDCEIVADGDSAILSEANAGVGNGSVSSCIISGRTFTGQYSPGTGNAVKSPVFFQANNLPITFVDNTVDAVCGGFMNTTPPTFGGNQAVTIDANNSVISGNKIRARAQNPDGSYASLNALALRVRGLGSTVSQNTNKCYGGLTNLGYLHTPQFGTSFYNKAINLNQIVFKSGKFFKCIQAYTPTSAIPKDPTVAGSNTHWTEITTDPTLASQLDAANYGYYVMNILGSLNITALMPISIATQSASGEPLTSEVDRAQVAVLEKVSSDPIFNDQENWHLVTCVYKKVGSSARLVSSFPSGVESKELKLRSGMAAADSFQLHKIILSDADRNLLVIKRSELAEASDSDFDLI